MDPARLATLRKHIDQLVYFAKETIEALRDAEFGEVDASDHRHEAEGYEAVQDTYDSNITDLKNHERALAKAVAALTTEDQ